MKMLGLFSKRRRACAPMDALAKAVKPVCESLESRYMLTLSYAWSESLLGFVISGTGSDDQIDVVVTVDANNSIVLKYYHNGVYDNAVTYGRQLVRGMDGNDTITVSGATDWRLQLLLEGNDGNDTLTGSANVENIKGNLGDDSLLGSAGNDWMDGGEGADVLRGGDGNDTLCGDNGITAGFGNDSLFGDNGSDSLLGGNGNDTLDGGYGADTINGDGGYDTVDYSSRTESLSFNLSNNDPDDGASGEGDIVLKAWYLLLGDGNDTVIGHSRGETIFGGQGDDFLRGGGGNDSLRGDGGSDYLNGEDGDDTLHGGGGAGADELRGGAGIDTADYSGRPGTHHLDLDSDGNFDDGIAGENDLISSCAIIIGGYGNDTITGSSGSDTLRGGDGNDTIDGKGGTNYIYGEGGNDTLFANTGLGIVCGGDGDDTFYANDATNDADTLRGEGGTDLLASSDPLDDWLE